TRHHRERGRAAAGAGRPAAARGPLMALRRVPVGRIAVVIALGVGIWAIFRGPTVPHWRTLAPGVEFVVLRGEPYCRTGSSDIAVLRLDPARATLRVLHCSLQPERVPLGLLEW